MNNEKNTTTHRTIQGSSPAQKSQSRNAKPRSTNKRSQRTNQTNPNTTPIIHGLLKGECSWNQNKIEYYDSQAHDSDDRKEQNEKAKPNNDEKPTTNDTAAQTLREVWVHGSCQEAQ